MVAQGRVYVDRRDAGFELGKLLEREYKDKDVLVLGIPRGGVVIAYEVASVLRAELSVVITKKLPHPSQEELAIGAVAEDGSVYLNSAATSVHRDLVKRIKEEQHLEIVSRIERFRQGRPLPDMKGRTVIIADDGIATGSTLVPAIKLCRKREPGKIIVAAPVAGRKYLSEIDELADEVVIAEQPPMFYAVGQVYEDFHHVPDEEVQELLENFEKKAL